MASWKHWESVVALLRMLLDLAYPPRCPACRADVAADGNFCASCFSKLRMITAPLCAFCGIPFVVAMGEDAQCPACLEAPPEFDSARAAMVYDAISSPLVTSLKFNDQWSNTARMVQMMQAAGHARLLGADVLVPVPLHWRRLLRRRFNQSAVLAYGLAKLGGLPCRPELLQRVRATQPQMRLDRATRKRNVARAFAVPELAKPEISGKVVVLVDDVMTTGATAEACAKALKQAGAREVRVLTLARTVKE